MCLAVETNQGQETKEQHLRTRDLRVEHVASGFSWPEAAQLEMEDKELALEVKTHVQIWDPPLQEDGQ